MVFSDASYVTALLDISIVGSLVVIMVVSFGISSVELDTPPIALIDHHYNGLNRVHSSFTCCLSAYSVNVYLFVIVASSLVSSSEPMVISVVSFLISVNVILVIISCDPMVMISFVVSSVVFNGWIWFQGNHS